MRSLRLEAKLKGYKSVHELASALGLSYNGMYRLYKDRPEEFQLRLDAIKGAKNA